MYKSTKIPAHSTIPKFTGEALGVSGVMSIEAYLRVVEKTTRSAHWTEEQKILLAIKFMGGRALTRINNSANYNSDNWALFKDDMKKFFSVKKETRLRCFHNYQPMRRKGETIGAFVDRIATDLDSFTENGEMDSDRKLEETMRICSRALPRGIHYAIDRPVHDIFDLVEEYENRAGRLPELKLTETDIASENLKEKPWSLAMGETEKETVNALSNHAVAPTESPVAGDVTTSPPTVPPAPPPQQTVAAAAGTTEKSTADPPTQKSQGQSSRSKKRGPPQRQQHSRKQNQDSSYGNCHTCGRKGHRRQDCVARELSCYNCGTQGHLANICRFKKNAPNRQMKPKNNQPRPHQENRQGSQNIGDPDAYLRLVDHTINSLMRVHGVPYGPSGTTPPQGGAQAPTQLAITNPNVPAWGNAGQR